MYFPEPLMVVVASVALLGGLLLGLALNVSIRPHVERRLRAHRRAARRLRLLLRQRDRDVQKIQEWVAALITHIRQKYNIREGDLPNWPNRNQTRAAIIDLQSRHGSKPAAAMFCVARAVGAAKRAQRLGKQIDHRVAVELLEALDDLLPKTMELLRLELVATVLPDGASPDTPAPIRVAELPGK